MRLGHEEYSGHGKQSRFYSKCSRKPLLVSKPRRSKLSSVLNGYSGFSREKSGL